MFSTPLWLFALGALVVPLALHLWSRRPRDVIRVGSLRHFDESTPPRARTARLSEPLLLLLRLGVLTAIVLALAGPRIGGRPLGLPSRITLVEPALLADPMLDSLRQARARVRLLAPGLPELTLPAEPASPPASRIGAWEALTAADRLVAAGGAIDLYARARLDALGVHRPTLHATVRWHAPTVPLRAEWLVSVTRLPEDSLQAIYGSGDATGTDYRRVRAAGRQQLPQPDSVRPVAPPLRRLRLVVPGADSLLQRRARLAIDAVALEAGQPVTIATDGEPGDTSLFLTTKAIATPGIADTVYARWPWAVVPPDPSDPRAVSIRQAAPQYQPAASDTSRPPRTLEFLLVAGVLLILERWLGTRPHRRPP